MQSALVYPNSIDSMSKLNKSVAELMNLTKEQLIRTIRNEQQAKRTAIGTENTVKQSRQGTKFNVKPKNKTVKRMAEFFEAGTKMKSLNDQPEVLNFKKKPVSLRGFREEEMKRAQISRTAQDTTFQHLSRNRLKAMKPQTQIQITLDIDIRSDGLTIHEGVWTL